MNQRLIALHLRHQEIDEAVHRESTRPAPDSMTVRALKKARLKLKDDIAALMRLHNNHYGPQVHQQGR